eukprot:40537_1
MQLDLPDIEVDFEDAERTPPAPHHLKNQISPRRGRWWLYFNVFRYVNSQLTHPAISMISNYESMICVFCRHICKTVRIGHLRSHLKTCRYCPPIIKQQAWDECAQLEERQLRRNEFQAISSQQRIHFNNHFEANPARAGTNANRGSGHDQNPINPLNLNRFYPNAVGPNESINESQPQDVPHVHESFFFNAATREPMTVNHGGDGQILAILDELNKLFCMDTVVNQTPYNRYEKPIVKRIMQLVVNYHQIAGSLPPLPNSYKITTSISKEHMIMMKRRVDQEIFDYGKLQLMVDETTKCRLPKLVLLVNLNNLHLVAFIKSIRKRRKAFVLHEETNRFMCQYTENGIVVTLMTGDNCRTMLSFRDLWIESHPDEDENGCVMHAVANCAKKIDDAGAEIFKNVITMCNDLVNWIFNGYAHQVFREACGTGPNEMCGKPTSSNTLQWVRNAHLVSWVQRHEQQIVDVFCDDEIKVSGDLLHFFDSDDGFNKCLLYSNYQNPFKICMKLLCGDHSFLSDAFYVNHVITSATDYDSLWEYKNAMKDWALKDLPTNEYGIYHDRLVSEVQEHTLADLVADDMKNDMEPMSDDETINIALMDAIETIKEYGIVHYYFESLAALNDVVEASKPVDQEIIGYYVINCRFSKNVFVIPAGEHEECMRQTSEYWAKHWSWAYRPIVAAAVLLDVRYKVIDILIPDDVKEDGLEWLRFKLRGKIRATAIVDILKMFRSERGVFLNLSRGLSSMSKNELLAVNPTVIWQKIKDNNLISSTIWKFSDLAIHVLNCKPDIVVLEKFMKNYRSITGHLRQHKGPISQDHEAQLRYNAMQLHSKYGGWY